MPYGKFTQSKQSMGLGRACPAILPCHFTEKCHDATIKMGPRQRQARRPAGTVRLAPRKEIPHTQAEGLYRTAPRRALKRQDNDAYSITGRSSSPSPPDPSSLSEGSGIFSKE